MLINVASSFPVGFNSSPSSLGAAAKLLQSCPTLCDPIDRSPPGSPSLGFSRQEHWSGVPFPSPMHESEVPQLCPTLCDTIDLSPPGSPVPGILQARTLEWGPISFSNAWKWKVKMKSCPTLSNPMDCSLLGSSIHGIFPGKSTGVGCHCLLHPLL